MTQDILLNENRELIIKNGDIFIGESEEQHIELILLSKKGHWKESPEMGAGIISYLNSSNRTEDIESELRFQLELDEWQVRELDFSDLENVYIDARKNENYS